jgi:hypothetical protein
LTAACALAVWLVVRPAAADAPICDDRAASGIAPAPTLDVQATSIDEPDVVSDACAEWVSPDHQVERGHRPDPQSPPSTPEAMLTALSEAPDGFAPLRLRAALLAFLLPPGVTAELERPPRA